MTLSKAEIIGRAGAIACAHSAYDYLCHTLNEQPTEVLLFIQRHCDMIETFAEILEKKRYKEDFCIAVSDVFRDYYAASFLSVDLRGATDNNRYIADYR